MRNLALIVLLAASLGSAFAQTESSDSLNTTTFDPVVVTGQYEPQSVDKSVYKVRVIPMEVIKARGAVQLQDVLRTELNIRFQQDMATGSTNMTMQGLGGQNVKVLVDGIPLVGRQSIDNSFNINQININTIERIEIIEGPMSVVYGADALAGVINVITKKSPDGKFDLTARVLEETVGKEYGLDRGIHNQSVGGGYTHKKFTIRGDVSRNFNGGFKGDSVGREKLWHPKTQYLASGLVGYNGQRSNIYYRLDYLNEDIYNPGNYGKGGAEPGLAIDQNYISNRFMHQLQGSHTFSDRLSFNGALAHTQYSRKVQITTVKESTGDVRLALSGQDLTKNDGTTFRGTFQYKISNKLTLQPGFDINYETTSGGRLAVGTHAIGDYAFFLSGEWSIVSRVQVRPGLRITHNTVYQAPPVMPSLNAKIKLSDRQDLRLSYGRGFRAPSLRELYMYFYDASHQIEGNPNLKAETSNSFNGSWNVNVINEGGKKLTTSVGAFFNEVHNMIGYGLRPGSTVTTLINLDKYKTKGVTWNNGWRNANWDVNAGFGYTARYNEYRTDSNESPEYQWSPEVTTTINYKTTKGGWNFLLYYKYTGKLPYPEIVTVNGEAIVNIAKMNAYQWADASVQKDLFRNLTATLGSHNLFDIKNVNSSSLSSGGAHTAGPIRAIGSGRSYYLSLTYVFNK